MQKAFRWHFPLFPLDPVSRFTRVSARRLENTRVGHGLQHDHLRFGFGIKNLLSSLPLYYIYLGTLGLLSSLLLGISDMGKRDRSSGQPAYEWVEALA